MKIIKSIITKIHPTQKKKLIRGLDKNKRAFHTCSKSLEKYEDFTKFVEKVEEESPSKLPVYNNYIVTNKTVPQVQKEIIIQKNVYTFLDQINLWINEINIKFPNNSEEKEKAFFDLQRKIELDWVINIKSKLLDPNAPKQILTGFILRTFESWTAFMENNREHKKILKHFPSEDLISELKKIESLIIGFTMIITHYKSKSYTNVAYSIGYQCLFNIFINKKEVQEAKDEARKAQDEARRARDEAAQTKASCEAMKQRVIDFEARLAAKK